MSVSFHAASSADRSHRLAPATSISASTASQAPSSPSTLGMGSSLTPVIADRLMLTPQGNEASPIPCAPSPLEHSVAGKRERGRERRIMPARLQRVSNLLAGSTLEDELAGSNSKQDDFVLPAHTRIVLHTGLRALFATAETNIRAPGHNLLSTPAFVDSCRTREMIETPDFRVRDDTEMMGKTRSIRSEEDTSDAAYERKHRRPDNLEKKQRRLEKERLVRDRQKLKERIDQLRVADPRLLMPILTAREQHQKLSEGESSAGDGTPAVSATPSPAAGSSTVVVTADPNGLLNSGVKSHYGSFDQANSSLLKLESLRSELLEEANETLKRYDALLAPTDLTPLLAGKRKAGEIGGVEDMLDGANKISRSISVSGAFAAKNALSKSLYTNASEKARSASASTSRERKPRVRTSHSPSEGGKSTKRLSLVSDASPKSPSPFKPEDGPVRAENTYANIHARTSGGRFAPKSALAGHAGSTSKINTKGKWKAEGRPKPVRRERKTSSQAKEVAPAAPPTSTTVGNNRKRVKIVVLNKRRKDEEAGTAAEGISTTDSASAAASAKAEDDEVEEEMEVDLTPQKAARAALTLEEAQALLAKAMEDDDDDDDDDEDGEVELEIQQEGHSK